LIENSQSAGNKRLSVKKYRSLSSANKPIVESWLLIADSFGDWLNSCDLENKPPSSFTDKKAWKRWTPRPRNPRHYE